MDSILKNRLEENIDIVTTVTDYRILLQELSNKTGIPIDELREGKGRWTYKDWSKEFKRL